MISGSNFIFVAQRLGGWAAGRDAIKHYKPEHIIYLIPHYYYWQAIFAEFSYTQLGAK